jgi:hypothetical protein
MNASRLAAATCLSILVAGTAVGAESDSRRLDDSNGQSLRCPNPAVIELVRDVLREKEVKTFRFQYGTTSGGIIVHIRGGFSHEEIGIQAGAGCILVSR